MQSSAVLPRVCDGRCATRVNVLKGKEREVEERGRGRGGGERHTGAGEIDKLGMQAWPKSPWIKASFYTY